MFAILSRRRVLTRSVAALLGWAGLPPAKAQAATACPHPLHRPLFADRPGPGWWYKTELRLACPLCRARVHHRGYLPESTYAYCRLLLPPDGPQAPAEPLGRTTTFVYDPASNRLGGDTTTSATDPLGRVGTCTYDAGPPDGSA